MSDERDIVERLLEECEDVYDHSTRLALHAAVDEIERLRAALQCVLDEDAAVWSDIVRNALKPRGPS